VSDRLPEVIDPVGLSSRHDVVVHGSNFGRRRVVLNQTERGHVLAGELYINIPFGGSAMVVDDADQVHSGCRRSPGERTFGCRAHADQRVTVEPEHVPDVGRGARLQRNHILRRGVTQGITHIAEGDVMCGPSRVSLVTQAGSGGGVRRGMPAWRNSLSMSEGQNSKTSKRVPIE